MLSTALRAGVCVGLGALYVVEYKYVSALTAKTLTSPKAQDGLDVKTEAPASSFTGVIGATAGFLGTTYLAARVFARMDGVPVVLRAFHLIMMEKEVTLARVVKHMWPVVVRPLSAIAIGVASAAVAKTALDYRCSKDVE